MSGSGVRPAIAIQCSTVDDANSTPGTRGRLRDAAVAGSDEEQAQGRSDRPRLAEAKE
jgi:hypothetical protein